MSLPAADVPAEMRKRIRAYFLSVFVYFLCAFGLVIAVAVVSKAVLDDRPAKSATLILANLSMLGVVVMSWRSYLSKMKCPACDAPVWWLVSWRFSPFGRSSSGTCPKCGVTLFHPRRWLAFIVLIVVAVIAGAVAAGAASSKAARARQPVAAATPDAGQ